MTVIFKSVFPGSEKPVTIVGLGGEGVLRTQGRDVEARNVILSAIDSGIMYFDCARAYADSEIYYGGVWKDMAHQRSLVFQASKSAQRDGKSAERELDDTLKRMHTDYLDLWQIHDVRTEDDLNRISGPGGALEAFIKAKEKGKVRFIGVTGHHDPDILTRAVSAWPVDSVLMPVNPVEAVLGGFLTRTLPAAKKKGMAVIAMKIMGGKHYIAPEIGATPEILIRFALSYDITTAIVGCSSPGEVKTLASVGMKPLKLTDLEKENLMALFRPNARRLAFYRGVI